MSTVLVTGGAGFIGRHVFQPLADRGFEVVAVVHKSSIEIDSVSSVKFMHADLLNAEEVASLMNNVQPTHLLHFAWCVDWHTYLYTSLNIDWIISGLNLIREFSAVGGKRAIFAGTCLEYGDSLVGCDEILTPREPETLYGAAKHSLQVAADAFARGKGLSFGWGRVFNIYGPYENEKRLVPYISGALLRGEYAECSSGEQVCDYMHVKDVADAFVTLLCSDVTGAVNIASGNPVKVKTIINMIANILGAPERVRLGTVEKQKGYFDEITAKTERLNKELQWKPSIDLKKGIRETVEWWASRLHIMETES